MKHFKIEEFECHCGCGRADMDEDFLASIDALREEAGFPFVITSGFRCKEHNDDISGAKGSQHLFGKAADIALSGSRAYVVMAIAKKHNFNGIGIAQKGPHNKRFIHLDTRDGPLGLWSY
jgi:zinc D-Ala-D-Ala carboxypeptidase